MANPNPKQSNLTHFSSTYQPARRGRKPSKLKKYMKELDIGERDLRILLQNVLFNYDQERLQEIIKDPKAPMVVRVFVRSFLNDFKTGKLDNLEKMLDRVVGKAKATHELTGADGTPLELLLGPSQRKERLEELIRKHNADSE